MRNADCLREILLKQIETSEDYSKTTQIENLNQCIGNFSHNFANLNQYIYAIKENYDEIFSTNTNTLNELMNDLNQLSITNQVENFKSKKKIDFIKEDEIEEFMGDLKLSQENLTIFSKQTSKPLKIKEKIQHISTVSPLNIKNLSNPHHELITKLNSLQSSKNLTESLSRSQKILLLASFFANESSAKSDSTIFKSFKRTNRRHKRKNISRGLKSKLTHSFNVHRLIAIYAALNTMLDEKKRDIPITDFNIELLSDVNTLIHLNLIRYVQFNEFNFMARKLISNIGIDFAKKISDDFNIKLDDFISLEDF